MKLILSTIALILATNLSFGQNEFVGIAKYRMAVVGGTDEDSLTVVFDKSRILLTLYLPSQNNPGKIEEVNIIHDFKRKKQYTLNKASRTFKTDTLINTSPYDFIDTKKIKTVQSGICFHYKADVGKINKSEMLAADCLASLDYTNTTIKEFWFMGFQPIFVDSRVVMDFIVTEPDGSKPRVYIKDIMSKTTVSQYFDMVNYTEVK